MDKNLIFPRHDLISQTKEFTRRAAGGDLSDDDPRWKLIYSILVDCKSAKDAAEKINDIALELKFVCRKIKEVY
jgi:hypothetical protein